MEPFKTQGEPDRPHNTAAKTAVTATGTRLCRRKTHSRAAASRKLAIKPDPDRASAPDPNFVQGFLYLVLHDVGANTCKERQQNP